MIRNILSIYLFLAGFLTSSYAIYILIKGKSNYMRVFASMCLCISIYLLGYLLELNSAEFSQMLFWNQVECIGVMLISTFWLIVALLYTKRIYALKKNILILLLVIPVYTLLLRLTNSYHHLYYSSVELQSGPLFPLLKLGKGPWYYVYGVYIYFLQAVTCFLYYLEYKKSTRVDRSKLLFLTVASVIPYIGLILVLIQFLGMAIDYTALLMPFSILTIMYTTFKYDFLEINTLARDAMFENNVEAMILLDTEYRIRDFNKAAQKLFPLLGISMKNHLIDEVLRNDEPARLFHSKNSESYHVLQNGHIKYFDINSTVLKDSNDSDVAILKTVVDVTEREKLQAELKRMATMDSLSKLNNRDQFMLLADREFARAKKYNTVFSVLMIDIDSFKAVNDSMGHAAGDEVIREIGRLMKQSFRNTDIAGRIGGEEFAVLLLGCSVKEAEQTAEKFRKTVERASFKCMGQCCSLTISIGIASYYRQASQFDEILKHADDALYQSKSNGKNRTTLKSTALKPKPEQQEFSQSC